MTDESAEPAKQSFLALHDYGMGACWWWIRARSAREVVETFAWLEVVEDPESVTRFEQDAEVDVVDIDAPAMPPGLDALRAEREAQRGKPGFGALAGRDLVHLRRRWDEEDEAWDEGEVPPDFLMEIGSDGRRTRQVEVTADGTAVRSTPDDWVLNPPLVDLFDPKVVDQEISGGEFEEAWARARPMTEADW
ncbi:hypothetical protein [Streptomyces sp. NPDC051561]|uniref:hypothetical protein n=1 Tax=Streptomyces sp. NPDC051561 TaxID=3365658 RepID=UPI0037A45250